VVFWEIETKHKIQDVMGRICSNVPKFFAFFCEEKSLRQKMVSGKGLSCFSASCRQLSANWIPAFAGMTKKLCEQSPPCKKFAQPTRLIYISQSIKNVILRVGGFAVKSKAQNTKFESRNPKQIQNSKHEI